MKEIETCDLCGGKSFDVVTPPHSRKAFVTGSGILTLTIGAKLCRNCGFVFLSPRRDKEELDAYYGVQSRYVKSFVELDKSEYADLCKMQIKIIKRACGTRRGNALEIGTAEGYFLHLLSKEGFQVEGVEPSVAYKQFYSKHFSKIKMHWSMLENVELPEIHYCLCVLRHVLEHFESPLSILKHIYKLMQLDGYVYIEVPNLSRAQAAIYDYFHEEHLSYFTPQTIRYICHLAGFTCESVEEWDDNPSSSGFNYPVLRVIARKTIDTQEETYPEYTYSHSVIADYFKRRESFFSQYIKPLEADILSWYQIGKKLALFGGGPHTLELLNVLNIPEKVFICAFDNDSLKWGKQIGYVPIVSPKEVNNYKPDIVVISSREFENEIAQRLHDWQDSGIKIIQIYNLI